MQASSVSAQAASMISVVWFSSNFDRFRIQNVLNDDQGGQIDYCIRFGSIWWRFWKIDFFEILIIIEWPFQSTITYNIANVRFRLSHFHQILTVLGYKTCLMMIRVAKLTIAFGLEAFGEDSEKSIFLDFSWHCAYQFCEFFL